ncbi:MAG: hypothetical protein HQM03_05110 [Magnetococcales bacterium]|nr:hypothetical protein [Magnetococcales bacterium]
MTAFSYPIIRFRLARQTDGKESDIEKSGKIRFSRQNRNLAAGFGFCH